MVMQTQSEMKALLCSQLTVACVKSIAPLLLGIGLTVTIPLFFNKDTIKDKIVNGVSFAINVIAFSYSYITSTEINTLKGKLTMFEQLEKERFIQEQILSQNFLLEQSRQYYQPPMIEAGNYQSISTVDNPLTTVDSENSINEGALMVVDAVACPQCNSNNVNKNGKSEGRQKYKCKECNHSFIEEE